MENQNKNLENNKPEAKETSPLNKGAQKIPKVAIIIGTSVIVAVAILLVVLLGGAHKHEFGEWETIQSLTCTENGTKERYCSCGEKETQIVSAIGHDSGEWVTVAEPTCTSVGSRTATCKKCMDVRSEMISATGHNYVLISKTESNCTEGGIEKYLCSCGEEKNTPVAALGHDYIPATCTDAKTCTRCNLTEGSALGHTTEGTRCARCGIVTFEKLTYSGKGSQYIFDITLPYGTYIVKLSYTGRRTNLTVFPFDGDGTRPNYLWINEHAGDGTYTHVYTGSLTNGWLEVDILLGDGDWTLTIEAK